MQEMLALANEMAQRIAYDSRDWTMLRKTATRLVGDGVSDRLRPASQLQAHAADSNVWRSTSTQQPMTFVADTDEWVTGAPQPWTSAWGEWTMLGGQIVIQPIMGAGINATFGYLNKNCIALASGGYRR